MAAQVAGRRRHLWLAVLCRQWFVYAATRGAKGLRILICSLQTNTSELPMRRLPSRGCVFAMPFAVLKASLGQPRLIALNGAV